ncbi:hypothetical protein IB231_04535 [Pantoea sp. PNT02]|uniref:hypothetical protein n=1 Tax=Pantoea sp. PNT02 TaxID=2769261 RepID=UPI001784B81F|nr:hypothetical protein [Pantoea sp. PNT02]MBD9642894.1 hypothetical protein [Pantoea sp. PNT02]
MTNKELVAAGHALAKAQGADAPLTEIAKLVSDLATRLNVMTVRANVLALENRTLKSNLMYWDDQDPEAPYDSPKAIADDRSFDFGIEFEVQVAARMPNLTYRVSALSEYSCEIELVDGALPVTPATDAILNAVRAEGVEMYANNIAHRVSYRAIDRNYEDDARRFAAQLSADAAK